ncbi:MAG: bacillithiol biosynthesis cysteine-adding enzyme BshC [Candidatus Zixiibacteriota bacterium]
MHESNIKPRAEFHYSALYLDFLKRDSRLEKYLFQRSPVEAAAGIKISRMDRNVLCDVLDKQNKDFNSKPAAFEAIKKLRHPDTLCIFTGQQAGLFGGPLFTLYKAIDIIKRAGKLEKELKRPVVPVFWIACDDHDFDEINHAFAYNKDGEPVRLSYAPDGHFSVPVADICIKNEEKYEELKQETENILGGTEFSEELLNRLFASYAFDQGMVRAFARHIADILPDLGMVFFCPHNEIIKTHSKEFFKQLVERQFQIREQLEKTEEQLLADKYHIQAEKKKTAVHLFYHFPERTAIHFLDDSFVVGEKRLGLPAILDLIDKYPGRFSPDVLTRPIWQSFLFPVVAHTGGPSEIAYFCQIGNLFKLFGLSQPYYYSRVGATLVEKRYEDFLDKYNIDLFDLTGDIEQLVNRILADSFPEKLEKDLESNRNRIEKDYADYASQIIDYDQSLGPMTEQTWGKIDFALKNLEKKIFSQHKKKMETTRVQVYRLANALYPNHTFQERMININYYISKYGFGIVDYIIEKLDMETSDNQMIYLSQYKE